MTDHELREALRELLTADSTVAVLPSPAQILKKMIEHFGGEDAFVKIWHEQLQEAIRIAPGKKYVLDHFRDMLRLMQEASARQASAVDLNAMTEEEVRRYLADLVVAEAAKRHRRVDLVRLCITDEGETPRQVAVSFNRRLPAL